MFLLTFPFTVLQFWLDLSAIIIWDWLKSVEIVLILCNTGGAAVMVVGRLAHHIDPEISKQLLDVLAYGWTLMPFL